MDILRKRTGAPEEVWYDAAKYLVDIHNVTSDETLGQRTPSSARDGETPDISAFLQFQFYETVYFWTTMRPSRRRMKEQDTG